MASSFHIHVFSPIFCKTLQVFRPIQLNWTSSIPRVVVWHLLLQVKCSCLNIPHHLLQQCAIWKSIVMAELTMCNLGLRRNNHVTSCCIINLLKDEVWPVASTYIRSIVSRQLSMQRRSKSSATSRALLYIMYFYICSICKFSKIVLYCVWQGVCGGEEV